MSKATSRFLVIFSTVFVTSAVAGIASVLADTPPIFTSLGLAIKGADPVNYFTDGKPSLGNKRFEIQWKGAKWRFVSAQNRDIFLTYPEKYEPQYGGYCAYAVSQGYTAKIEIDAWTIVDNKLYLNYSKDIRRIWARNIAGHIASANRNWLRILD